LPAHALSSPHYDGHPTVLVRFSAIDVDELAELLTESWRLRAPEAAGGRVRRAPGRAAAAVIMRQAGCRSR